MKHGKTACEWCLTECDNDHLQCKKCGGPITVLEPWVLQCGWCSSSNRRDLTTNCNSCGGELPHIPGTPRLPEPAVAPRFLAPGYENRIRYWKNPSFLVGAIFCIFLFPGLCVWPMLIFPLIGLFILRWSIKKSNHKLNALKSGVPTRGIILDVFIDMNQHINNRNPVRIDYEFDTPDGKHTDYINVWDETNLRRPAGEHLWIVFNPKNPAENNIWPPLS